MKSSFPLILFVCALIMPTIIRSHIIVRRKYTDQLIEEFYDLPALFGGVIPSTGLRVYPLDAYPEDACTKQPTPSEQLPNETTNNRKYVLIIARSNCTFEEKIRNAQNAKYDAAIVYNIGSDDLEQMSAKNNSGITIPAVFVGETSGRYIIEYYINDTEYVLIINDALPFNINKNLIIPFSILVGLCFIIMIFYMIYKCVREQRRLNQHRLPKRLLKKIPVIKFSEGQPYENCIICLEDYKKGEKIRILPCKHAYHCHCVDVWLTKNRRVCPMCKRKVFVRSENRNQARRRMYPSSDSTTDTDDDVQPLINLQYNSNNHGTFPQNEQNDNNNANQRNTNNQRDVEQPTDDENVLNNDTESAAEYNARSRRENPFNRISASNDQSVAESNANERRSFWNFFKFGFLRRSDSLTPLFNEIENPNVIENSNDVTPISVDVSTSITASNNILNANLSGSFQDNISSSSSILSTASAPPVATTVQISNSKKKNKSTNLAFNLLRSEPTPTSSQRKKKQQQQQQQQQEPTSVVTSSQPDVVPQNASVDPDADVFIQTPSQGGIGVAALPNINLNRDQSGQNSQTRRNLLM